MKRVTISLEDENLFAAVESEAARAGKSVQDIVVEALEQWLIDAQLDEDESQEIEAARREWREKGGVEAHEFFQGMSADENGQGK